MSIYYDVKEHIIIKNTAEQDDSLSVYSHRLARIGALMLEDNARFKKLVAITDGKKREFSGNTMTKKFHDIMRAIGRADSVEIFADYGYHRYGLSAICPKVLDFADYLDSTIKEFGVEGLDGLFYSLYNNADCSDDAGAVVAYGEKNGTLYTEMVEEKNIDILPDGVWYSPQTAVIYDPIENGLDNIEEIEPICREMTKFSCYDELEVNEDGISFYLNNLELHNNDEFVEFIGLCRKLLRATDGKAWAEELDLADLGGDDGKIVKIKINDDGTHEIVLCSVE